MSAAGYETRAGITRRDLLPMAAAALVLSGEPGTAGAALDPPVTDALYNLAWIPDGTPWQKHIYIISAPWCPVCKRFFNETRDLVSGVQLRWIPAGTFDGKWRVYNAVLARSRDIRRLTELYTTGGIADAHATQFDSIDLNEGVIFTQSEELERLLGEHWGFPTLVYRTGDGTGAFTGIPNDIAKLVETVVSDETQPPDGSKGSEMLRRTLVQTPIAEHQSAFAKGEVPMFALPFSDAPQVFAMQDNTDRQAFAEYQTDAGRWTAVRFLTRDNLVDGVHAYVPSDRVELRPA